MEENQRAYEIISAYYDFWQNENVTAGSRPLDWALYAHNLISEFSSVRKKDPLTLREKPVLFDLGCGTGHIASAMSDLGYRVTGVDFSDEMLASANYLHGDKGIIFINQDIRDLDIPYKADVIVSFLDTVNHLHEEEGLNLFFKACAKHLKSDGLLLFDILSLTYYRDILNGHTFTDFFGDDLLVWDNHFDGKTFINTASLSLFTALDDEEGALIYERLDTDITEKYYETSFISDLLFESGFEILETFADLSRETPDKKSQRLFFLAGLVSESDRSKK